MVAVLPRTRLGAIGFWLAAAGLAGLFAPYWIAMALRASAPAWTGIIVLSLILAGSAVSVAAIVKGERAWLIYLGALSGCFALLLVVGEFLVAHFLIWLFFLRRDKVLPGGLYAA